MILDKERISDVSQEDQELEEGECERVFFYPNCGDDLKRPLKFFIDDIDVFEFVDISPTFDVLELIQSLVGQEIVLKYSDLRSCETVSIPGLKNVPIRFNSRCFKFYLKNNKMIKYTVSDSFLHLLNLEGMDIFYYKGDSAGEGGSGQSWFAPEIFSLVLAKLKRGGKLITDGSNLWMRPEGCETQNIIRTNKMFTLKERTFYRENNNRDNMFIWKVV